MVAQERYPELKSNQNFLALQSQLEGTENRIAIARRDYNLTAQTYNTTLRTFPSVLWAKTLYSGQKPAQLFQATASVRRARRPWTSPARRRRPRRRFSSVTFSRALLLTGRGTAERRWRAPLRIAGASLAAGARRPLLCLAGPGRPDLPAADGPGGR
jgi:hypothetical protein